MRKILHLHTTPPDPLAQTLPDLQRTLLPETSAQIEIVDLSGKQPIDYSALLQKIFAADSISTW